MDPKRKINSIKCPIYCEIDLLLEKQYSEALLWTGKKNMARLTIQLDIYLQHILIFCAFDSSCKIAFHMVAHRCPDFGRDIFLSGNCYSAMSWFQ